MNDHNPKKLLSWFPYKESIAQLLVGSIPLKVGVLLRRILYRHIFAQFGNSVTVQTNAEFIHTFAIALGDNVKISRDVRLDCGASNSKITIGNDTWLERGVDIKALGGSIEIDESTYIGPYICIAGPGQIKIGKNCLIASHSAIYANCHNFTDPTIRIQFQGISHKGIVIEDDCWIGIGVRILDGITIGQGSVIGAGAVVTKDIPPYSIAVGVPARVKHNRKGKTVPPPTHNQQDIYLEANNYLTPLSTNLVAIEQSAKLNRQYSPNKNDSALAEFFLEKLLYIILEYIRRLMYVDTGTVLVKTEAQQELAIIATTWIGRRKVRKYSYSHR
ncbi:acyltransferase [Chlorogloeopsis sp. ULAP01]|uniref:acyltransferase n=1 Tax=Chlorogloeopsis sp. ULAP01 TaxID=3056483 RepID=UPI0025AA4A22|nr:acyltransferase [Chlorogloeopsis sp. ULAP01]MDM9382282.1 acyltransferase [Chlorogloeopsis sp. ULAP01]